MEVGIVDKRAVGPPAVASACALAYVASKVHLALENEIGIAGFYVRPEVNQALDNPAAAQWGNAAIGLVVAMVCLALAWPISSRWVRLVLLTSSCLGVGFLVAGVVGFTLRALGMTSSPEWEPTNWMSLVTLTIGWLWVVAWFVAIIRHWRVSTASRSHRGP